MEDSEIESSDSELVESKKRKFPLPTPKGVFMFVGVAMIIAVLGMAGYVFYKGPDSKSNRLVAKSESSAAPGPRGQEGGPDDDPEPAPTTTRKPKPPASKRSKKKRSAPASADNKKSKPTKKGGHKRRSTTGNFVQDAPQEAPEEPESDKAEEDAEQGSGDDSSALPQDNEEDNSEEEDNMNAMRVFKEDPHCTTDQELYQCDENEQPDMMRSYICMSSSREASCLEWRPQRLCLSSEENRFGSEKECKKACQGAKAGKCGKATLCECTKLYRKMNYVFDVRRQRCRLVALHECVEKEVGFVDEESCKKACPSDNDARCKLAALEDLVRPCLWQDKKYTHFYDHRSGRCKSWDEDVCGQNGFTRLTECLKGCRLTPKGAKLAQQQLQDNSTLG